MQQLSVKKGDMVKVIAGKDKGKQGEILRSIPSKGRVVVENINIVKKAVRPTQQNPQGGINSIEAPIDASNVMLVCPHCKAAVRTGHRIDNGIKKRICRKCGKDID